MVMTGGKKHTAAAAQNSVTMKQQGESTAIVASKRLLKMCCGQANSECYQRAASGYVLRVLWMKCSWVCSGLANCCQQAASHHVLCVLCMLCLQAYLGVQWAPPSHCGGAKLTQYCLEVAQVRCGRGEM